VRAAARAANAAALRAGADPQQLAGQLTAAAADAIDIADERDAMADWDLDAAITALKDAPSSPEPPRPVTSQRQVTLRHLVASGLLDSAATLAPPTTAGVTKPASTTTA